MFSIADVLKSNGLINHKSDIHNFSFQKLIKTALADYDIDEVNFYAGKINIPKQVPELVAKSHMIAESQRRLKRSLTNQNINYVMAGHVRLQDTKVDSNGRLQGVFKEKGTDVQIAVDMVAKACDKDLKVALLMSSDSDMQPAVKELRKRDVPVIYIGFENNVNAGLSTTTSKTIIVRSSEIIDAWNEANPQQAIPAVA